MTTTIKTCFKCNVAQPIENFYRHPRMKDGTLGKCKECAKYDTKQNYIKNADYYANYDRERALLPHRILAREIYAATEMGKLSRYKATIKYRSNNPLARVAHRKVAYATSTDKLAKLPCEKCGAENVHAHHDDYTKPLEVRWLCSKHHYEHHKHN